MAAFCIFGKVENLDVFCKNRISIIQFFLKTRCLYK